jgi:hypothetical protein
MKKKLQLTSLLTLFSVALFSQTTHTFTITEDFLAPGEYTVSDTTVQVGDIVEFVNGYTVSNFNVEIDGVGQPGYNPSTSVNIGQTIFAYTFQPVDALSNNGNMDILVYAGGDQFRFHYIHFTVVEPSTVSISEINDITYKIYPNPTTDFLNIYGDNIQSVKVFDTNGRLVLSGSNTQLDVSSLDNGFYTVMVNEKERVKLIKK